MQHDEEFKVKLSLSTKTICNKDKSILPKINFKNYELSTKELLFNISLGVAYSAIYRANDDELITPQNRNANNWIGSQIITYDIDNALSNVSFNDYISTLELKPTLAYTTFNHQIKKGENDKVYSKFRLLYIIDSVITDEQKFKGLYNALSKFALNYDLLDNDKVFDNCGSVKTQIFFGNEKTNIETYISESIYNIKDFDLVTEETKINKSTKAITTKSNKLKDDSIKDNEVLKDYFKFERKAYLAKYQDQYKIINESVINYNNDGYALLNEDYININYSYVIGEYISQGVIKKKPFLHILHDGEHRRKMLFIHSVLRRQCKPQITLEELLYNIVYEAFYMMNNDDKQLTNEILYNIAKNALNHKYHIQTSNKKRFKVDKQYCIERGISANSHARVVSKMLRYEKIGELYDISLSVMENLKNLKKIGVKVCRATLYNFCKDNGINPKGELIEVIDDEDVKETATEEKRINNNDNTENNIMNNKPKNTIIETTDFKQNDVSNIEKRPFIINGWTYQKDTTLPPRLQRILGYNHFSRCKEQYAIIFNNAL